MDTRSKTIENRLRQLAKQFGYRLVKSQLRKHLHFNDQGLYQIINARKKGRVVHGERFELTLDDVEQFFNEGPQKR